MDKQFNLFWDLIFSLENILDGIGKESQKKRLREVREKLESVSLDPLRYSQKRLEYALNWMFVLDWHEDPADGLMFGLEQKDFETEEEFWEAYSVEDKKTRRAIKTAIQSAKNLASLRRNL